MLKDIQPSVFNDLGNLTHLLLHSDMLKEIGYGVLNGFGPLAYLNVRSNILAEVQPDVGLGKCRRLSLANNLFIYLLKPYLYRVTLQSVKSAITGALWAIDIKIL